MTSPGKKIYALVATLLFCYYSNAQENRIWATYYGGSSDETSGNLVCTATDASGNVYIAGTTTSPTGIASSGGHQVVNGGSGDVFLVKFDAAGNRVWATYYGGAMVDYPNGLAVDDSGNVFLAGETKSTTGIASGGFQNTIGGGFDAFLVKFNAAGVRQWGTYYGGSNDDGAWGLGVDHAGNALLTGYAISTSGIASGGYQLFHGGPGGYDAFLVKFSPNGSRQWATYYGGPGADFGFDVAADAAGNIYLAGQTTSSTAIASGGFQNTTGGTDDAFLVKFTPNGARQWATYFGGSGFERGASVAIDNTGHPILSGLTQSTSGIASGGFQNTYGGGGDAFLAKFDSTGARLWSTYYGGTGGDGYAQCCTDASGNIYLAAQTNSTNAIFSGGFQSSFSGGTGDAFLVRFDANGNRLAATYYGDALNEYGIDLCTDNSGNIYVGGITQSTTGIASGGFQNTFGGGATDLFLAKFSTCSMAPSAPGTITGTSSICQGTTNTYAIPAVNGAAYYTWTLPGGWTGTSTTTSITATAGTTSGTISVTADNSCGASAAQTLVITVIAPAVTSDADTSVCMGASVNLSAGGASTYAWNPGNMSGSTITISPSATTTYTVTGTDGNGCTGTSTTTITVNALPTVSASATNNPVCAGNSTTLNSGGASTYLWMPGSLNGSSVSVSPAASTTYTVTGTDVNGCADTQTVAITVNSLPNVSYTETQTNTCVNWNPITLTPGVPAGGVYSGTAVTGNTFAPATAGAGTYAVTYTYTDINGCSNTATSQIVVDLCTGVTGADAPGSVEVFPNPFRNTFLLSTAKGAGTLRIYTMPGDLVYASQVTNEKTEIDLSHLSPGMYLLQLTTAEGNSMKRIIKE